MSEQRPFVKVIANVTETTKYRRDRSKSWVEARVMKKEDINGGKQTKYTALSGELLYRKSRAIPKQAFKFEIRYPSSGCSARP